MAISCPIGFDVDQLRREVSFIYARVAEDPSGEFHFHRGPALRGRAARLRRGGARRDPGGERASFAGVGNPHCRRADRAPARRSSISAAARAPICLLAARKVGPTGKAIGVDMTPAMAERARAGARAMGFDHVDVRIGDALELPVESNTVDVVISNGVINLTPDKQRAYAEAFRILKPGGRFQLADIIVANELSENIRGDID